jgi:hypothetical protein
MDYPEKLKQALDEPQSETSTLNMTNPAVPYPVDGERWGKWEFDAESLVLKYRENGRNEYEVDLGNITSSAGMLDWIFEVSSKTWASREDIGNLVSALGDLLCPQANLCPGGSDKQFDPVKYMRDHRRTGAAA